MNGISSILEQLVFLPEIDLAGWFVLALAVYRLNRGLRSKFSTRVSLLRVLPFSRTNQIKANPRKYWRVWGIY